MWLYIASVHKMWRWVTMFKSCCEDNVWAKKEEHMCAILQLFYHILTLCINFTTLSKKRSYIYLLTQKKQFSDCKKLWQQYKSKPNLTPIPTCTQLQCQASISAIHLMRGLPPASNPAFSFNQAAYPSLIHVDDHSVMAEIGSTTESAPYLICHIELYIMAKEAWGVVHIIQGTDRDEWKFVRPDLLKWLDLPSTPGAVVYVSCQLKRGRA